MPTPGVIQEMKWLEVELAKKAIGKAIMEQQKNEVPTREALFLTPQRRIHANKDVIGESHM